MTSPCFRAPSRRHFASLEEKERVLLDLDVRIAAELARAEGLRRLREERNARLCAAQASRPAPSPTVRKEAPMRDLTRFYGEAPVRVHLDDEGEPWFVASDVAKILDITNPRSSLALLDEDEKGVHTMDTPGGAQEMGVVSEAGLYSLILRSRKPEARPFKRWVTHEVLPSIRRTGSYSAPQAPAAPSTMNREQLLATALIEANSIITEAHSRAIAAEERAAAAAQTVRAIEATEGLTLTEFHKHYFSDVGAREFFEFCYSKGLLIDQRGARGRDAKGRVKNGPQHMHPTAKGKEFIYLHASLDAEGLRRERPRVRPGAPEVALARWLHHRGLRLNEELVAAVEGGELVRA